MLRTRALTVAVAALVIALIALAGSALQFSLVVEQALAQSSVRPPDNAVNVGVTPGAPTSGGEIVLPGGSVRPPQPAESDAPAAPGTSRTAFGQTPPAVAGQSRLDQQGPYSDADIWKYLRKGGQTTVSIPDTKAAVLVQDDGMKWLRWRANGGPLQVFGGYAILGTVALLAAFFLLRGRIRIHGGRSGETIRRFRGYERFAHWLLAGSFIVLALTGLDLLYGKDLMVALFAPGEGDGNPGVIVGGHERFGWNLLGDGGYETAKAKFAGVAQAGKWLHNNIAWAFMAGLVIVFLIWVADNIPGRGDVKWLARAGGFLGGKHPPARKFNAGQKIVFWAVILLGLSISLSGISLLFPYQVPMFGMTFGVLNDWGISGMVIGAPLPVDLSAIEEMQYAEIWHAIVAFAMIVVIIGHIYIGTLGMEGAFAAMGSGQVDRNWAEEHHSLWVAEQDASEAERAQAVPAE